MKFLSAGLFILLFSIGCTKTDIISEEEALPGIAARQTSPGTLPSILQWQKCMGSNSNDESRAFIRTSDGGYLIAANTGGHYNGDVQSPNRGGNDAWMVKLDATGAIQWQTTYGGPGYDWIMGVAETSDGFVFSGVSHTTAGSSNGDGWIIKLDRQGSKVWETKVGGSLSDSFMSLVIESGTDNVIAVGQTKSTDNPGLQHNGGNDVWIIKFNSAGEVLWSKAYGGALDETGTSILIDGNTYVIAGNSASVNGDLSGIAKKGGQDIWLFKISAEDGTVVSGSHKVYGGSAEEANSRLFLNGVDGYVVTASTLSNNGDVTGNKGMQDAWVAKLDANLNLIGSGKCFGGAANDAFRAGVSNNNEVVLTGFTESKTGDLSANKGSNDVWILKLDNALVKQNSASFGGRGLDIGWGVAPTVDGYFVLGRTDANGGDVSGLKGGIDVWLLNIKY